MLSCIPDDSGSAAQHALNRCLKNPVLCCYFETSLLTHSPIQELLIWCLINMPYHAFSDEINSWVLFCK